jgi:hypothetical protein
VNAAAQYDLPALLEMRGARSRGKRHDCPRCGGRGTLTHAEEVFYCHRCQWRGNAVTLARELGLARRLSPAEYRELRQNRERADRAARALYGRIKARRFELLDRLHMLNDLEARAHRLGPDNPETWDALAGVYAERPGVLAELGILENCPAANLLRFLSAGSEERQRAIDGLIARGGLCDAAGRFMDVPTR